MNFPLKNFFFNKTVEYSNKKDFLRKIFEVSKKKKNNLLRFQCIEYSLTLSGFPRYFMTFLDCLTCSNPDKKDICNKFLYFIFLKIVTVPTLPTLPTLPTCRQIWRDVSKF